jgi:hypothetical protein
VGFTEVGSKVNETVSKYKYCSVKFQNICQDQIDWEESANAGRVCVRLNIDEELDNRKHVYHGIDSVLVSNGGYTGKGNEC